MINKIESFNMYKLYKLETALISNKTPLITIMVITNFRNNKLLIFANNRFPIKFPKVAPIPKEIP